jgi:hypothetical protein
VAGLALAAAGWWLVDFRFGIGWEWGSPRWWIASAMQGYGYLTVFRAVLGYVLVRRRKRRKKRAKAGRKGGRSDRPTVADLAAEAWDS